MKKQTLLLLFVSMLFVGFTTSSCSKKGDDVTKEEEEEDGGGNANISKYLKGSDYYLLTLDASSEKNIGAAKIKGDYRTDDLNMFLYVWDGTYGAGSSSGPNSFGEVEGWTSLVVNTIGWSGCGFSPAPSKFVNLSGVTSQHKLHFAMKSKDNATHQILLYDGVRTVKVTIGATAFEGVQPYTNFTRDGEWHHIEIPMTYLEDLGLRYTAPGFNSGNALAILSGPVAGTTLDIDGVFFYKPAAN